MPPSHSALWCAHTTMGDTGRLFCVCSYVSVPRHAFVAVHTHNHAALQQRTQQTNTEKGGERERSRSVCEDFDVPVLPILPGPQENQETDNCAGVSVPLCALCRSFGCVCVCVYGRNTLSPPSQKFVLLFRSRCCVTHNILLWRVITAMLLLLLLLLLSCFMCV